MHRRVRLRRPLALRRAEASTFRVDFLFRSPPFPASQSKRVEIALMPRICETRSVELAVARHREGARAHEQHTSKERESFRSNESGYCSFGRVRVSVHTRPRVACGDLLSTDVLSSRQTSFHRGSTQAKGTTATPTHGTVDARDVRARQQQQQRRVNEQHTNARQGFRRRAYALCERKRLRKRRTARRSYAT